MPTPSTLDVDVDALFAQTLRNYKDELVDNIFKGNALTAFLMDNESANREEGNGGERIQETLMYGKNTTVGSYSGYDTIDVSPQDNVSAAFFQWKQLAGSVAISGKEEKQNKGRSQIRSMLESKTRNLRMSMKEELNRQLLNSFQAGNNGKDLTPVTKLVAKDPTDTQWNPVGAIDGSQSSNDFWRNKALSSNTGTTSTKQQLKEDLYSAYNRAMLGTGGSPDLALADLQTMENYELSLDAQKRYVDEDVRASLGFDNLAIKNGVMIMDEMVPDVQNEDPYDGSELDKGTCFFFNTDFMSLVQEQDTIFEPTEFKKPANQDARVAQVLWMGAITISNRRKHSVLYNIEPDLS